VSAPFWQGTVEPIAVREGSSAKVGVAHGSLLCNTVVGQLTPPIADRLRALGDEAIATTGKLWIFCDWSEMTGYDSRCRTELTEWAVSHGEAIRSIEVFTNARLVRMGVTVASIFIKRVVSHDDVQSFREAYRGAARRAHER
jgi:hypothetical protein